MEIATGRLVDQGVLEPGERHTMWRTSQLGHRFLLTDTVTRATVLDYTVPFTGIRVIGDYVMTPLSPEEIQAKNRQVEQTLKFEFDRRTAVRRTFTKTGFDKVWPRRILGFA